MAYLDGSRSNFPEQLDSVKELYDLSPRQLQSAKRLQELKTKQDRTSEEEQELNNLTAELQDFMPTAEDWNRAFDMSIATQKHYRDNTINHVNQLKQETTSYVDGKKVEMNTYTDTKQQEMASKKQEFEVFVDGQRTYIIDYVNGRVALINNTVSEGVSEMDDKRRYFTTFVNTKVDEVQNIVQEFHTDTKRYYTTWVATEGQIDFNVFMGSNENLPPEANLNIPPENIDLMINGVLQTPYTDYTVFNNGNYDTIKLTSHAQSLIQAGTELVAKWYKNVGKLYFRHGHSHGEGGYDEISVTKGMLDSSVTDEFKYVPHRGSIPPNPEKRKLWIDTSI